MRMRNCAWLSLGGLCVSLNFGTGCAGAEKVVPETRNEKASSHIVVYPNSDALQRQSDVWVYFRSPRVGGTDFGQSLALFESGGESSVALFLLARGWAIAARSGDSRNEEASVMILANRAIAGDSIDVQVKERWYRVKLLEARTVPDPNPEPKRSRGRVFDEGWILISVLTKK